MNEQAKLTVQKIGTLMPFTQQMLDEQREWQEGVAAFNALPPAEQARIRAENVAKSAAEKAERTCEHCGCDPQEHGDY